MATEVTLQTQIRCPHCGVQQQETMPTNACIWYWQCPQCQALVTPKKGDCCVYCSYATMPCPPVQLGAHCCDE
ncbi:GDCCVxC domain-containing (seleno)protein [Pontibacterium sp.]|uniref:GDCCVxC domain-containing (seleno)protein n=1 Tax=Pontibacterium sp. TaxID=2036026 RepID=UPI00351746F2